MTVGWMWDFRQFNLGFKHYHVQDFRKALTLGSGRMGPVSYPCRIVNPPTAEQFEKCKGHVPGRRLLSSRLHTEDCSHVPKSGHQHFYALMFLTSVCLMFEAYPIRQCYVSETAASLYKSDSGSHSDINQIITMIQTYINHTTINSVTLFRQTKQEYQP